MVSPPPPRPVSWAERSRGSRPSCRPPANPICHIFLRGGTSGRNYDETHVSRAAEQLDKAGFAASVMVDCSHGNSSKDYRRQPEVARNLAEQIAAGQGAIFGVMLESFLVDGRQELKGPGDLVYGQSITDACLGWDSTVPVLRELAQAVQKRRSRAAAE